MREIVDVLVIVLFVLPHFLGAGNRRNFLAVVG